jgi:hypothetical protein
MIRTRRVLQVFGGFLALAGSALLVSWSRTHGEMNHDGVFLFLGGALIGVIGLVMLLAGSLLRPDHSEQRSP